jgi:hypothetical protein
MIQLPVEELVGKQIGKYTIVSESEIRITKGGFKIRTFNIKCECGKEKTLSRNDIYKSAYSLCKCNHKELGTDIIGNTYSRLTVVSYSHVTITPGGSKIHHYNCNCSCGGKITARKNSLIQGNPKSCGCISKEKSLNGERRRYGVDLIPEYGVWLGMKGRCYNLNDTKYKNYGARGIIVCNRWLNSFHDFLEDMGNRPSSKHSIERDNVNGNYEPNNCRWATDIEQANNRTNNRVLEIDGISKNLCQWADEVGIKRETLAYRINSGMSPKEAIKKPVKEFKNYKNNILNDSNSVTY